MLGFLQTPRNGAVGNYQSEHNCALNSEDVVAFLEHLLREVPDHMVIIWDGAPIHRSHVMKAFLANGAAHRIHLLSQTCPSLILIASPPLEFR